jgi:hypothetical protein
MQFTAFATSLDDEIRGGVRPAMWLLMGASACLLLIACANVANLLLVRGDARMREIAVRSAIGASTERLARQLVTESLVLAVAGAVLGLGLAWGGLRVLMRLDPTSLPPLAPVRLDATVVVVTLVLSVVAPSPSAASSPPQAATIIDRAAIEKMRLIIVVLPVGCCCSGRALAGRRSAPCAVGFLYWQRVCRTGHLRSEWRKPAPRLNFLAFPTRSAPVRRPNGQPPQLFTEHSSAVQ